MTHEGRDGRRGGSMFKQICVWALALLLAACTSGPAAPDWQLNARAHVERFTAAYLEGNQRVHEREFELALQEVSRTGQADQIARVQLNQCALQVASLNFEACQGFEDLRQDVNEDTLAYARYLSGQMQAEDADIALLPAQHQAAARGQDQLADIDDPLARLVAAGVLLRRGQATPERVAAAVDTASAQGWRRPLLAWLGVQLEQARQAGNDQEAARLQRRMDWVAPAADAK